VQASTPTCRTSSSASSRSASASPPQWSRCPCLALEMSPIYCACASSSDLSEHLCCGTDISLHKRTPLSCPASSHADGVQPAVRAVQGFVRRRLLAVPGRAAGRREGGRLHPDRAAAGTLDQPSLDRVTGVARCLQDQPDSAVRKLWPIRPAAVLQDELVELFASMDKAKGGVESGFVSKVRALLMDQHAAVISSKHDTE
jgi:hypothetical protein